MSNPNTNKNKKKPSARHNARCAAMQALYQWQMNKENIDTLIHHFREDNDLKDVDLNYFKELLQGAITHIEVIDETMQPKLDRDQDALNPVELAILRFSVFELMYRLDIPYRVVINEALEVAKKYGAPEGFKYINGVLDALVPDLREAEYHKKNGD